MAVMTGGAHLVGGGQGYCQTPRSARDGPPQSTIRPQELRNRAKQVLGRDSSGAPCPAVTRSQGGLTPWGLYGSTRNRPCL